MARKTRDERRIDYLDAGVELLTEETGASSDPGLAFAHVRVTDVAERAGVTKGAIYHLWDSQEAYWHDLLLFLLAEGRLAGMGDVADATRELVDRIGPTPDPIAWANHVFDRFKDDPSLVARLGILSYLRDDDVRSDLADEFRTSLGAFETMVAAAVDAMGRGPREGTDVHDLSVAIACLMHGFVLEHRIDPARTADVGPVADGPEGSPGRVSLFAAAVTAMIEEYTEPINGEDDPEVRP